MVDNLKDQEYIDNHFVVLVTKQGTIKKTSLEAYSRPRANGINAINVREEDTLLEAKLTTGSSQIMIATREGKAIRFDEDKLRPMGRNATGVRIDDLLCYFFTKLRIRIVAPGNFALS